MQYLMNTNNRSGAIHFWNRMMELRDNGFTLHLSRLDIEDIIRSLAELEAMRQKYQHPEWVNGYDVNTANRAVLIREKLANAAGQDAWKTAGIRPQEAHQQSLVTV